MTNESFSNLPALVENVRVNRYFMTSAWPLKAKLTVNFVAFPSVKFRQIWQTMGGGGKGHEEMHDRKERERCNGQVNAEGNPQRIQK